MSAAKAGQGKGKAKGAGKPAAAGDRPGRVLRQVKLSFRHHSLIRTVDDPIQEDLSASARIGDSLFVSCDETTGVERLTPESRTLWTEHGHYNLGAFFDLPDGDVGEMDIEGLQIAGETLWIVGSHSLKRGKPDDGDTPVEALEAMVEIKRDPNRYFLGSVPLVEREPGRWEPVAEDGERKAAAVRMGGGKSKLLKWLKGDDILDPFLGMASKENGIDIEGIAVLGDRVWLGLRGPAIRGHALVVELEMKNVKKGRLKARRIEDGRRYRKYLIPSRGLGVRDLLLDGEDLLLLLGPVMSSDGPSRVVRWREAVNDTCSSMIAAERLTVAAELDYLGQHDHPEGLAHWPEDGENRFLVVYDAPSPKRHKEKDNAVLADVMAFD